MYYTVVAEQAASEWNESDLLFGTFLCALANLPKMTVNFVMSVICGNKMPPRCNRGFYCRSYCLLNMFRLPLCPSSGAQEYYTVVAACGISCCGFQVVGLVSGVCRMLVYWPASYKPDT
jgi:hypothetical protein